MVILTLIVAVNSFSIYSINLDDESISILDSLKNELPEESKIFSLESFSDMNKIDPGLIDALILNPKNKLENAFIESLLIPMKFHF